MIQQIGDAISLLRENGKMAIVLVEQNADFAFNLADEFVLMNRGRVTRCISKPDYSKLGLIDDLAL